MNETIQELQRLNVNGFQFKERTIRIRIHSFICDAPAKAMIKILNYILGIMDVINVLKLECGMVK
jgi:hypothetical protein